MLTGRRGGPGELARTGHLDKKKQPLSENENKAEIWKPPELKNSKGLHELPSQGLQRINPLHSILQSRPTDTVS